MVNDYYDNIELLLKEYSEYIKSKEKQVSGTSENYYKDTEKIESEWPPVKPVQSVVISDPDEALKDFRWFPKGTIDNGYDAYKKNYLDDKESVFNAEGKFRMQNDNTNLLKLSDNISRLLEPFAALEVDRMDYTDSPIYSGLDKEILSQMAASAYTNAVLNISELGDLEAQSSCYSKEQMLRALIRELIIKEIFFMRGVRH